MKKINITLFFAFVLLTSINPLFAQEFNEEDSNEMHENRIERLTKALSLTPDQIIKTKEIHLKYKPELEKVIAEAKPIRNKMKAIRDKKRIEFEDILTAEQKTILTSLKQKKKERTQNLFMNKNK